MKLGDITLRPGALGRAIERRIAKLESDGVVERIWRRDHTVWKNDPTEISDRLGWLDLPDKMRPETDGLKSFAEATDEFDRVVLLGMGGSSLAPEVLSRTFGGRPFVALETTHPESIKQVEDSGDLRRTLFIVSSKSGTTVETLSQFAYFYDKVGDGSQFVAITDAGSPLEQLAGEKGFRRAFVNPSDIGGRYSALSYFGLAPAALIGIDAASLLEAASDMAERCRGAAGDNPGAALGAAIGEAAIAGRDKLTVLSSDTIASFGTWLEQLIAESTGKEGKGIVPVEGEPSGPADVYGEDRLFAGVGIEPALEPALWMPFERREAIGAEFFRWEFATAVAGHILGIHPFDQPNVQEAKDATNRLLKEGTLPQPDRGDPGELLNSVKEGDYIAIQAYLPRTPENEARLQEARLRLRDRHRVATTVGFGPRFLHSTGQLHKGGPNTGVFIQVVDEPGVDLPIPGKEYTFRGLLDAQAAGDLEALRAHGRRVARTGMDELEEV